jgi:hypothetical protein
MLAAAAAKEESKKRKMGEPKVKAMKAMKRERPRNRTPKKRWTGGC